MGVYTPIHIVQVFDEVGMRFKGADVLVSERLLLGANVVAESESSSGVSHEFGHGCSVSGLPKRREKIHIVENGRPAEHDVHAFQLNGSRGWDP